MSDSLKKLIRPRIWIAISDLAWLAIALALARLLHMHSLAQTQLISFAPAYLVAAFLWTATAYAMQLHHVAGKDQIPVVLSDTLLGVVIFIICSLAASFMTRGPYSRLEFFYFGCISLVGFIFIRLCARVVIKRFRSVAAIRTVVLGSGRLALEVARKVSAHPEYMREFIGFLYPANNDMPGVSSRSLRGSTTAPAGDVQSLLRINGVQEIILAGSEANAPHTFNLVQECRAAGIRISVVPSFYDLYSSRAQVIDFDGLPVLVVEGRDPGEWMLLGKGILDFVLLVPVSLVALPVLAFATGVLALCGRNPFRSEVRCGLHGHEFRMWKLNIRPSIEAHSQLEEIASRLSITEMPQLLNVWRREMSLVGPRPENPERVKHYSDWQRRRLLVRPGITGAAQVKGLRDENTSEDKARHDLQYIYNWSPFLDLSLLLQTVWTLLFRLESPFGHHTSNSELESNPSEVTLGVANVDSTQPSAN